MRTNKRASGIIIRDKKVLLIRRFRKERGEYFVFPGGGVESDETVEDALVREMKEELGIEIDTHEKLYEFSYKRIYGPGDKNDHYFLITEYSGEPEWIEGNEGPKENQDNQYFLEWHDLDEASNLNLLPTEMKEKISDIKIILGL